MSCDRPGCLTPIADVAECLGVWLCLKHRCELGWSTATAERALPVRWCRHESPSGFAIRDEGGAE